jgi:SulP family sulfate permease
MLIGFRTLKPDQIRMVWRTGKTQATVMATTFLLTLLVPMQYAVMVGVGISVILFVARQSNRVTVKRWAFTEGSPFPTETTPPSVLPADEIVVLTPYGSLFFASATVFESQLPVPEAASRGSAVVLRMRGKEDLGSTFINTIVRYHDTLVGVGSHLVLTGISERVLDQLTNTEALHRLGAANVFSATPEVGQSLEAGLERARGLQVAGSADATP